MKKWIIIGVTIAAVVALIGVAACLLFRDTWSAPDMVRSMKLLPDVTDACNAAWIPDGSAILYASSVREGCVQNVYKTDSDGGNKTCLGEGRLLVWSPDGSMIAFATDNGL
jgi:Tol biopolymer transport system component